ncbi:hypothetical protein [Anaerobacillus sp. CMMVII]|uniref:hypothetical protein n=1 Tax=Anaerobacillus sp. CMMVII TaxID=2755588 RepID=UPI0021B7EE5B|nr:hypothetical protein [Anaerobacillus sp. CMMVII]
MRKLSERQWFNASSFLKTRARKLEKALFEYEFENGSKENVVKELVLFQNSDGGFGKGLEPDFRCEHSSALATVIGLRYLTSIGIEETNEVVKNAVDFLLNTFNREKMGWEIVPKEVETAPRAFGGTIKKKVNGEIQVQKFSATFITIKTSFQLNFKGTNRLCR